MVQKNGSSALELRLCQAAPCVETLEELTETLNPTTNLKLPERADRLVCEHPALGDCLQIPFIIKVVDDIKAIRIKRLDGTTGKVTAREFADACQTMLDGLYTYGGHFAGFVHGTCQHCRVENDLFDTVHLD